jgi:hypothetical protein
MEKETTSREGLPANIDQSLSKSIDLVRKSYVWAVAVSSIERPNDNQE